MSVHEDLIAELLSGKVALSPRENAAVNEITSLREQLAIANGPGSNEIKKFRQSGIEPKAKP